MDQVFSPTAEASELIHQIGYPRRLLRRLIVADGVGPGSPVLDVGCGDGLLVQFMEQLGLKAAGTERSPDRVAALRRSFPDSDWRNTLPGEPGAAESPEFDLIIVRDEPAYRGSVQDVAALRTTAGLLAALHPGGTLTFVFRRDVNSDGALVSHDGSCFLKHIECFPGECHTAEFSEAFSKDVFRRLLGTARLPGFVLVSLTIPQEPIGSTGWLRFAEVAARSRSESCCEFADKTAEASRHRSAA